MGCACACVCAESLAGAFIKASSSASRSAAVLGLRFSLGVLRWPFPPLVEVVLLPSRAWRTGPRRSAKFPAASSSPLSKTSKSARPKQAKVEKMQGSPFEARSEIESRKQRLLRLYFGTIGTHLLRNTDHLSLGLRTIVLVLGLECMVGIVVHHHCPTRRSVTSIVLYPATSSAKDPFSPIVGERLTLIYAFVTGPICSNSVLRSCSDTSQCRFSMNSLPVALTSFVSAGSRGKDIGRPELPRRGPRVEAFSSYRSCFHDPESSAVRDLAFRCTEIEGEECQTWGRRGCPGGGKVRLTL